MKRLQTYRTPCRIFRLFIVLWTTLLLAATGAPAQALIPLYSFTGGSDGGIPASSLLADASGNLYGTTLRGGTNDSGTVFKLTPSGTLTVLHSFAGGPSDGAHPQAGLIADAAGNLYGTTLSGGGNDLGTVYKLTLSGSFTVLHSFAGGSLDGSTPAAGLIADAAGNLYGTTVDGGTKDLGTVYKLAPSGVLTVLHSFAGAPDDGEQPHARLLAVAAGNLIGTTLAGGAKGTGPSTGDGIVFQLTPSGTYTVLHSFLGYPNDGGGPYEGVIADASGNLYGATSSGGSENLGTVFRLTPSGTITVLHSFSTLEGANPMGTLLADPSGDLYGTAVSGGGSTESQILGTAFKVTPSGILTVLHRFSDGNEAYPNAGLIPAGPGSFYGTTMGGGASGWGTVYKLVVTAPVTITSNVPSSTFSVSGTGCQAGSSYTAPQTLQWTPGGTCTVTFDSQASGGAGTRYLFTGWTDGVSGTTRTFTAPSSPATYTANFKTQYQLTALVSPAGAGIVTGGDFYDAGATANVAATANAGYQFAGWSPVLSPNTATSSVIVTAPQSVTANFTILTTTTVTAASGQYSDPATLTATVGPADAAFTGSLQFQVNGVNAGLPLSVPGGGVYSTSYVVTNAAGSYPITAVFTSTTSITQGSSGSNTLTVTKEDATITPAADNARTAQVSSPGGTASSITLTGTVQQSGDGAPGDLSKAVITVSLVPAVSSRPSIPCAVANSGGSLTVTCANVPVNAYTVQWTLGGNYYAGPQVNTVLAVYDPSLGFVTGSGTLVNNGVPAEFSISVKYQKDGSLTGGGVIYIEHRTTGDFTVRSTALTSMSIVGTTAVIYGQASVNGAGSYPLQMTVTDNGEPGNRDTFGCQASPVVSLNPVTITGGNIKVH